jgi:hypothetical protein
VSSVPDAEGGYTLAEALAAMLIIGLAMGMAFEGFRTTARIQSRVVTTAHDMRLNRRAEQALSGFLRERPLGDTTLTGDAGTFSFDCVHGRCSASVVNSRGSRVLVLRRGEAAQTFPLPAPRTVKIVYVAIDGRYDHWPPSETRVGFRGVAVVEATGENSPVIIARTWIEQPKNCEFDLIAKACRLAQPTSTGPMSPTH